MPDIQYPRLLSGQEKTKLRWLLPEDAPGYERCWKSIQKKMVIGEGRWGKNDLLLASDQRCVDTYGSMTRVFAFGLIEYEHGYQTITIHEEVEDSIEIQFHTYGISPETNHVRELRRYCYSYWKPGQPSPRSGSASKEVRFNLNDVSHVLVISCEDERIWLHQAETAVNHLIPLTQFYNDIMRQCSIRDPETVLKPKRFFSEAARYSDADLGAAFRAYNSRALRLVLPEISYPGGGAKNPWFRRMLGQ